jgi:hypothetical protein
MSRGRVGEEREGKETDRCPLTGDMKPAKFNDDVEEINASFAEKYPPGH